MESKDVEALVEKALTSVKNDIADIKETVAPIPALVERLSSYKEIEKQISDHEYVLHGTRDKPGIVNDIVQLKARGKRVFDWFVKIAAFFGSAIGIFSALKAFNIF